MFARVFYSKTARNCTDFPTFTFTYLGCPMTMQKWGCSVFLSWKTPCEHVRFPRCSHAKDGEAPRLLIICAGNDVTADWVGGDDLHRDVTYFLSTWGRWFSEIKVVFSCTSSWKRRGIEYPPPILKEII